MIFEGKIKSLDMVMGYRNEVRNYGNGNNYTGNSYRSNHSNVREIFIIIGEIVIVLILDVLKVEIEGPMVMIGEVKFRTGISIRFLL